MKKFLLLFLSLFFVCLLIFFLAEERNHVEDNKVEDSKGYVTFWFDDGLLSTYKTAFPVLRDKEWQAVLAVVSDYEKAKEELSYDGDFPMDMEKVLELANYGWEISSHSMTHSNLDEIDNVDSLEMEIIESKEVLENHQLTVYSFTFPYGAEGCHKAKEIVEKNYYYWRSTASGINSVPSQRYLKTFFLTECADESVVREWIQETEEENGWLIIILHSVIENPVGWWQQTPEQFMMVLEMIEESDLEVVLPKYIFEKYGYAEEYNSEIDSISRAKITEKDFKEFSFEIIIPEIKVDADLHLASSLESDEIDFSALDDYPVLISDEESYFLSPLGDYGVSLIIGHRNLDFRRLDRLKQGDQIFIANNNELNLNYEVSIIIEIKPEEIWAEIKKIREESLFFGKSTLVLMTCTPYPTNWRRLLIIADLKDGGENE